LETKMIKVLIVDDSQTVQCFLSELLNSDPEIEVIGTVGSGQEALKFVSKNIPDVITMDLEMPKMSGLDVTRQIMETHPIPIVIVSENLESQNTSQAFQVIDAGAVAAIAKPHMSQSADFAAMAKDLIQTVKTMAEIKLVRRRSNLERKTLTLSAAGKPISSNIEVIAIGASTGGPPILCRLLQSLPDTFPVPIVIAQHIAPGFTSGLSDWLKRSSSIKVKVAEAGETLQSGIVYLAPDDKNMSVSIHKRVSLATPQNHKGACPSVSQLFQSVCDSFGAKAVGIILTGMGSDGAVELKRMRDRGAITIAQDEASCVVFGMPAEAIKLGAAVHILSPDKIASMLRDLTESQTANLRQ
jgi:two-component system, chemotaxis family, protein-glutamate methylesterase/glutaminase